MNIRELGKTGRLAATATALVLLAGTGMAQADVTFHGSTVVVNRVSGETRPQQITRVGSLDNNRGYVKIVYAAEKGDDPCWLRVTKNPLPGGPSLIGGPHTGFGCVDSTVRSGKSVEAPSGRYITALRICVAKRNSLMKGIEVKFGRLRSNNTVVAAGTDRFKRPACKTWSRWSSCPSNAVLIAVNAHMRAGSPRDKIVGLQSICKRIRNS